MRTLVAAAVASSILVSLSHAQSSEASVRKSVNIEAQDLSTALQMFARERKLYLIYAQGDVINHQSSGASGDLTQDEGLKQLLRGTGLTYRLLDENTITIVPVAESTTRNSPAALEKIRIRLAQSDQATTGNSDSRSSVLRDAEGNNVQEVIVTASKRGSERLQDVPMSITVIGQDHIERSGIDDLLDYARSVPGMGFQVLSAAGGRDDLRGGRRLNLRGIDSGFDGVPTVAFYLDEAPVPVMDPKLFDVERIEVLRGPQGTLWGANSMGGTLRVVMNKPKQNVFEYRGDTTVMSTTHGDESINLNAMINVPLAEDKAAVRAVMFYRDEGGFIDHIRQRHPSSTEVDVTRDINGERSWGVRLATELRPTDRLRIMPSVFHQETIVHDTSMYEPNVADLGIHFLKQVPDRQENEFTLHGLEIGYDAGALQFAASTASFESKFNSIEDLTKNFYAFYGPGFFDGGPVLQRALNQLSSKRFSQEVRVTYDGARWDSVAGVFYMKEDRRYAGDFPNEDGSEPILFTGTQDNTDKQLAVFGEVTYAITDQLDFTAGARWFDSDSTQYTAFESSGVVDIVDIEADGSAVSPKAQLRYRLNPDQMVYVSATRGFRPGGPSNVAPVPLCSDELAELGLTAPPTEFDADTLWSYELGTKLAFSDRLTVNAVAYFIDWKDVQQSVGLFNLGNEDCGFTFVGNVGAAESRGVELEFTALPTDALKFDGSIGFTDAKFTKSSPGVDVEAGDRLALVPRWTASASIQYSFDAPGGRAAYLLFDAQFKDKVLNGFNSEYQASHILANSRIAVQLTDSLELSLFVSNLFDERPQLSAFTREDYGILPQESRREIVTSRPRTYGLTFRFQGR